MNLYSLNKDMLVKLIVEMEEKHKEETEYLKFIELETRSIIKVKKCSIKNCKACMLDSSYYSNLVFENSYGVIRRCKRCFNNHCEKHIENCKEEIDFEKIDFTFRYFRKQTHLILISYLDFIVQRHEDGSFSIDNIYDFKTKEVRGLNEDERKIADKFIPFIADRINQIK